MSFRNAGFSCHSEEVPRSDRIKEGKTDQNQLVDMVLTASERVQ